jgi:hypothetical protein
MLTRMLPRVLAGALPAAVATAGTPAPVTVSPSPACTPGSTRRAAAAAQKAGAPAASGEP